MSLRSTLQQRAAAPIALATKDLRVAWSYRVSFVLGHLSVLASLVLFYFVSRVVGQSEVVGNADDYFRFVVIGIAISGVVEQSVAAAVGAARRDQVEGTLEAVAALPLGSAALGVGWVTYPIVDAVVGMVVTLILALPLGLSGAHPNWLGSLVVVVLSVVTFASLGMIGAAMVIAFQQGAGVIGLVLSGLGLISGSLFPVSVMPHWLEVISQASPLRHALDAMRATTIDGASLSAVDGSVLTLLAFTLALVPIGIGSLEVAMRRARRTGGLSRF